MPRISANNALKLSAWLAVHEPKLFRQLYSTTLAVRRSPLGRLGYFGDDSGLAEITVTAGQDVSTPDFSSVDTTVTPDVSLTDISFDPGSIPSVSSDTASALNQAISAPDTSGAVGSDSSGGFWSSIASGASGVVGAIGKVASALTSPQAITAAGGAAAAYFKGQATSAQLQAQQAAVNAQLSRVAQGYAPAAMTYQRNPYTGGLTPVYQGTTGTYQPVTPSVLSRLSSPGTMGVSPGLLIGGGVAALLLFTLAASRN